MQFFRSRSQKAIERLIKQGVGVHETTFVWLSGDATRVTLTSALLSWLRKEAGQMRRPNGIDQVVVALACRDRKGDVLCTSSFGVIRPTVFYHPEGVERVDAFLDDAELVRGAGAAEIVVAMLSLGDVAYALQDAAAA